jgi:hypothetical protein
MELDQELLGRTDAGEGVDDRTPLSPITTPAFEPPEGCAFGLSTAAHTFGATCLSANGDCRGAQCAQSMHSAAKSTIGALSFIAATGRSHRE